MRRCLELAEQGRGTVGNAPMVGSVLVRKEKIIGEGYFDGRGPHAESVLFRNIDQKISSTDVLYVSLEPCVPHSSKKTSGCVPAIIASGIKHVVIGMLDPDSRVSGKGIGTLRDAGIEVTMSDMRAECEWLNRGYISVRTNGRPWITLKCAKTKDDRIANDDGSPLKITSKEQDIWSHTFLRATHDAILVGVGTVIVDDPSLNTRFDQNKRQHQAWRIVLDPNNRMPKTAKLLTDEHCDRTIVVRDASWENLWRTLIEKGITSVLVEGGAKTWKRFYDAKFVDADVTLIGRALLISCHQCL